MNHIDLEPCSLGNSKRNSTEQVFQKKRPTLPDLSPKLPPKLATPIEAPGPQFHPCTQPIMP